MNSYEEFRIMHTHRLVSDLSRADEKSAKVLCESIDERIDHYSKGDLDYAVDAVTLLWKLSMAGGSPPPAPQPAGEPGSPNPSARRSASEIDSFLPSRKNCELIESALIKSIRTSKWFDRRHQTRHPNTAKTLRPVHISSLVAGDKLHRINDSE